MLPLKDYAFEKDDEKVSSMLFGSLGFTAHSHRRQKPLNEANAFKNTDGGVRYIKQLKYKMQRHKDLEEEFEDMKVKKESKYQNPLHEQTRKIFLNDLEELKAKIKGRRQHYNNAQLMQPAEVTDALMRVSSAQSSYSGGHRYNSQSREGPSPFP